jgi:hypothetical protein
LRPIVYTLETIGFEFNIAARLIILFLGIFDVLMLALVSFTMTSRLPLALLVGTAYAVCFSNLVLLNVPETYALSQAISLIYLYLFVRFARNNIDAKQAAALGFLGGIAALSNAVLLTIGLIPAIYIGQKQGLRSMIVLGAVILFSSVAVFLCGFLAIFGISGFSLYSNYVEGYASIFNFLDFRNALNVLLSLTLYSVIAPSLGVERSYSIADAAGYVRSITGSLLVLLYLLWLYYVAKEIVSFRSMVGIAVITWLAAVATFYLYFNPHEAIIYSGLVLPYLFFLFSTVFAHSERLSANPIFCGAVVVLGIHNVSAVFFSH